MNETNNNRTKVSVIGGAGFIGTSLCKLLFKSNIPFEIIDLNTSHEFPVLTKIGDVRSYDSMQKLITGDVIVNLAAVHRDDVEDINEYYSTNVDGAKNISLVCLKKNIKKIIFTSSVAIYGIVYKPTNESGLINPFNDYGKSKFLAENEFISWADLNKKNKLTIIRPTVVFGEGNRGNVYNLLNQIAKKKFIMIGSGKNKKSLAYVENLALFIKNCINTNENKLIINYADSPDLNMNELISFVLNKLHLNLITKKKIPYSIGLMIGIFADILGIFVKKKLPISYIRIKKFCGTTTFFSSHPFRMNFKAPYSLTDGLAKTVKHEFIDK